MKYFLCRAAKLEKLDTSEVKCEKAVKKEVVAKKRKHNDGDYNTTQANVSGLLRRRLSQSPVVLNSKRPH